MREARDSIEEVCSHYLKYAPECNCKNESVHQARPLLRMLAIALVMECRMDCGTAFVLNCGLRFGVDFRMNVGTVSGMCFGALD